MLSVIFPGQGSQIIGMAKEFYHNFNYVKDYFLTANEILKKNLSRIILEGPKDLLDQTENTQPAIFLVSYIIFKVIEKETNFKIMNAKYFAGHSLGEYSALCCSNSINFEQTINLLKDRGTAMQNAVPNNEGGMTAVLGTNIDVINEILEEKNKISCYVANDNSNGQIVVSGMMQSLELFENELTKQKIKFVKLQVSAPFHSPLMRKATEEMKQKILNTNFKNPQIDIISNVTAKPVNDFTKIKNLLIEQIENPVRWRESINNMIELGIDNFVEVGPGKVLSGLIKRINRNVKVNNINTLEEVLNLTND